MFSFKSSEFFYSFWFFYKGSLSFYNTIHEGILTNGVTVPQFLK